MPRSRTPLSARQKKFCREYVKDLNASAAAVRAGYSKNSSREIASKQLTRPNIMAYVAELQKKLAENAGVTAEEIVEELKKCGFSNVQDFIKGDNMIKDISKIDRDKAAAVSSIKVTETFTKDGNSRVETTFKLTDKVNALVQLGRHVGIFEKDNKQGASRINLINDIPKKK